MRPHNSWLITSYARHYTSSRAPNLVTLIYHQDYEKRDLESIHFRYLVPVFKTIDGVYDSYKRTRFEYSTCINKKTWHFQMEKYFQHTCVNCRLAFAFCVFCPMQVPAERLWCSRPSAYFSRERGVIINENRPTSRPVKILRQGTVLIHFCIILLLRKTLQKAKMETSLRNK